jgi:hypothetical protein
VGAHRVPDWKFRAAYSSAALAANTFAPMTDGIDLPGVGFIAGRPELEVEYSAGTQGFKPTLDAVIEGDDMTVIVESKCREYLAAGEANFSVAFPRKAAQVLSGEAARVFGDVYAGAVTSDPVDAPQLLKDVLAAEKIAHEQERQVLLLYAYWEPRDADDYRVFKRHADRAAALIAPLSSQRVQVMALSYRQLWEHWEAAGVEHVGELRARYDVALSHNSS